MHTAKDYDEALLNPAAVFKLPKDVLETDSLTTTQKLDYVRPYEVLVPAGHGLPEDSKVLLNQLRTIDMAERVRERLGILDDDLMMDVDRALLIVLFGPGVAA